MKFKDFVNPNFMPAFEKLATADLPVRVAYSISKTQKIIQEEFAKFNEMRAAIIKKWAEVDESGNVKLTEDRQGVIFPQENVEKFTEDFNELLDIEFTVALLKIDDLEKASLTANDLLALESLIAE